MKVFRIRITREHVRDVYRVFEFSARHTLYDIHRAIQQAFELDDDHQHAFFMSGRHWDAASEIDGRRSARTRLYEFALKAGQRFAYVFDFGDELWHELQVEDVVETETPPSEPRQVESVGAAPSQYADHEHDHDHDREPRLDASALVPLAKELVALFPSSDEADEDELLFDDEPVGDDLAGDDLAGDDLAGDDLAGDGDDVDVLDEHGDLIDGDEPDYFSALDLEPEALESAHGIALRLARELDGNAELFLALEEAMSSDLASLLADLPMALAHAERVDEGADLASTLAFIDPPHFLGDRAIILAEVGRRDEALAQVTHNLESQTGDSWAQVKAAEVYGILDDPIRAEALLRSALEDTDDDAARDGALDALLALLSGQDRNEEAAALLADERARLDALVNRRLSDTMWPGAPVQRTTAKVGRNEPCPCGSGKKYKKCCAD